MRYKHSTVVRYCKVVTTSSRHKCDEYVPYIVHMCTPFIHVQHTHTHYTHTSHFTTHNTKLLQGYTRIMGWQLPSGFNSKARSIDHQKRVPVLKLFYSLFVFKEYYIVYQIVPKNYTSLVYYSTVISTPLPANASTSAFRSG